MSSETRSELLRRLETYSDYTLWMAAARAASRSSGADSGPFSPDKLARELATVKGFVMSLPDCKEKLLLYYRYIRGMSMENTAELLGVSTRSAYRIRNRALDFAEKAYEKKCPTD